MASDDATVRLQDIKSKLDADDPRIALDEKCISAGLETEWRVVEDNIYFRIGFPAGREKRWRAVSPPRADAYLDMDMSRGISFLGDYDAVLFRADGSIESAINGWRDLFGRIPGIQKIDHCDTGTELEVDDNGGQEEDGSANWYDAWKLKLSQRAGQELKVEIGSASRSFTALADTGRRGQVRIGGRELPDGLGTFASIRITGVNVSSHDEALAVLEKVSDAVFFELDIKYNVTLRLAESMALRRSRATARRFQEVPERSIAQVPQYGYAEKPLSLYWYGRRSRGLPLLEYLAYYQVLEYYFPSFSRRDTLQRLRNELLDPRFRADDDRSLVRILALTSGAGKGYGSERDQLRSTIAGCATEDAIRDFIDQQPDILSHFSGKQKIKDVQIINLADKQNDLLQRVADRIYDIRCRIVHAKEDGGKAAADLLLPFSKEADALGPDIELVKLIAQKALISGASRLTL